MVGELGQLHAARRTFTGRQANSQNFRGRWVASVIGCELRLFEEAAGGRAALQDLLWHPYRAEANPAATHNRCADPPPSGGRAGAQDNLHRGHELVEMEFAWQGEKQLDERLPLREVAVDRPQLLILDSSSKGDVVRAPSHACHRTAIWGL